MVNDLVYGIIGGALGLIGVSVGLYFAFKNVAGASKPKEGTKVVSVKDLKQKLIKLSAKNPFKVKASSEEGIDLDIEWIVLDAKWIEILGKGWENMKYTAKIVFDETKKTLRYQEMIVHTERTMGPLRISGQSSFTKGCIINRRIKSYRYGIKDDGSIGEIYKFDFRPNDVKDVVRQIANDNGWTFALYLHKIKKY
ncbi:MAG: hypothetical protein ABIJ34_05935 [archaeon]